MPTDRSPRPGAGGRPARRDGDDPRRQAARPAARGERADRDADRSATRGRPPADFRPGSKPRDRDLPDVPAFITGDELGPSVVREIVEALGAVGSDVCRRLVAAADALEQGDDVAARAHAAEARRLGSRLAAVREAVGVVSYQLGDYEVALRDLSAAKRIGGIGGAVAVMADCERALGRPERALDVIRAVDAGALDAADRAELLMVAAGARADLGEVDAALATLRTPLLEGNSVEPWQERLWVAYADLLEAAGRAEEARRWLARAARHPAAGTDAAERLGLPREDAGDGADEVAGLLDLEELADVPGFRWRERQAEQGGPTGRAGAGSPVRGKGPQHDPRR